MSIVIQARAEINEFMEKAARVYDKEFKTKIQELEQQYQDRIASLELKIKRLEIDNKMYRENFKVGVRV